MTCCILMASLLALPFAVKRWLNVAGNAKNSEALKWRLTRMSQHDS